MNFQNRILRFLKKRIRVFLDFEFRDVSNIIQRTPPSLIKKNKYNALMKECDTVFIERLKYNKTALKLDYWKSHFELHGFENFPEIHGHLLDFGCGSGHLDILLARRGIKITGIDASPIAIRICEYLKNKETKEIASRLNFYEIDITQKKILNIPVDSVWSTQVFEHIENPKPIIDGIRQYVKKGTYFLICVPYGDAYDDPGHCNHFYSDKELENFLSSHINVRRVVVDYEFNVIRALCQF